MNDIENNLEKLGIVLPKAANPMGNFVPYLIDGSNLYISGQVSIDAEGNIIQGKLGDVIDLKAGQEAAKFCAIGLLARAKAALGDLGRIERLIKLGAFVNSTSDFSNHPQVVNGASDFMVQILGQEKGRHVRFAVGSPSLPSNAAVEIEAVFKITK
jgi:enamine deaminase RidA (YjgF/YER057c/UK114 family)